MKKMIFSLLLALTATGAIGRDEVQDHSDGRFDVASLADQLTISLDGLVSALNQRVYGFPVVYQAQRVAQAARTFAWNARYSGAREVQASFGWLRSAFDDLDYQIQNHGLQFEYPVGAYLNQSRNLIAAIEQRLYFGPGPGPLPGDQNWQCFAVDNGWEEHGANAHAGFGRTQWEAQQDAIYACQNVHGSCRVTNCRVIR